MVMGKIKSSSAPCLAQTSISLTVLLEKLSDKLGWIGENRSPLGQCLGQTS